jgi:hypothetical protein
MTEARVPVTDDALVEVTQADRDAAADYFVITRSLMPGDYRAEQYRTGKRDLSRSVQLLARHRLAGVAAGREEAASHLEDQARLYRHAQGNALAPTDKTYRMGQKDACLLEATAIRQMGDDARKQYQSMEGLSHEEDHCPGSAVGPDYRRSRQAEAADRPDALHPARMHRDDTAVVTRPLNDPPRMGEGWLPIEEAKKDGAIIWAVFHPRIFPDLKPGRPDLEPWNGVQVPLRHPGIFPGYDGEPFDMGWNVAAPVGNGGFPDEWIIGWRPLPAPPLTPPILLCER